MVDVAVQFFGPGYGLCIALFGFVLKNVLVHHVIFGLSHYIDYLIYLFVGDHLAFVFHFFEKEFGDPGLDIGNDLVAALGTGKGAFYGLQVPSQLVIRVVVDMEERIC